MHYLQYLMMKKWMLVRLVTKKMMKTGLIWFFFFFFLMDLFLFSPRIYRIIYNVLQIIRCWMLYNVRFPRFKSILFCLFCLRLKHYYIHSCCYMILCKYKYTTTTRIPGVEHEENQTIFMMYQSFLMIVSILQHCSIWILYIN
jgi:hypothetical protein